MGKVGLREKFGTGYVCMGKVGVWGLGNVEEWEKWSMDKVGHGKSR